eukprot:gene21259-23333_t
MPCTKDALTKHISRVMYQAVTWRRPLNAMINCPGIGEHGWIVDKEGKVAIDWMDLPPAADSILENVQCACKKGSTSNRFSCHRANLQCTGLCWCNSCSNSAIEHGDRTGDSSDDADTDTSDTNNTDEDTEDEY